MFEKIEIKKLVGADWNYKVESAFLAEKLEENLKKNGQIENIIIREKGKKFEVVNGNHRLEVMVKLGFKEVQCFNLGKVSDAQAKKIAIETNETKFATDQMRLGELLKEINTEFDLDDLKTTIPLTEHELRSLIDQEYVDWDEISGKQAPSVTQGDEGGTKIAIELTDSEGADWLKLKDSTGCGGDKELLLLLMSDAKETETETE